MSLVPWAYEVSRQNLSGILPRRWAHVQGVAQKARTLAAAVGNDASLLEAAAILHDVGYAPHLAVTGFHPLDGAVYLRGINAPERLVHLVAHHSCAVREARLRGLEGQLAEFRDEEGPVRDALWMCDLTTTPDGEPTDFASRVAEIKERYGPSDMVTAFIDSAQQDLADAITRTTSRLREFAG
ncbi:HD domain-containing protein [Micromonospora sp. NPDC049799]|uniref:HD domain-containing protein n=1 Tax=Micromonospora sp. NPDC049799 TaxID=3154741 RepID=UPI0033C023BA